MADFYNDDELSFFQSTYLIPHLSIYTFVRYVGTCDLCLRQKKIINERSASLCSFSDTTGHMIIKLLSNTIVRFHCLTLEGKRFENEGSTPSVAN